MVRWSTLLALCVVAGLQARADQIVLQSGDQLVGRLVAITNDTLVVQSDLLGILRLPRNKVVSITLSPAAATNATRLPAQANLPSVLAAPGTNGRPEVSVSLRQLGGDTNMIQQVSDQYLGAAGPEAKKKFDELLGGLASGKLDVNDIRAEAASTVNQIRALKRELGDDSGGALDGYLTILESFLGETASTSSPSVKGADQTQKPKKVPAKEAE